MARGRAEETTMDPMRIRHGNPPRPTFRDRVIADAVEVAIWCGFFALLLWATFSESP